MKVVILAGGLGTRLSEHTEVKPKPLVEIGGRPILWHIIKHYAHYGFKEFVVAVGYKGELIKRFFVDYHSLSSNMTVRVGDGKVDTHRSGATEDWIVHLIDTGAETNTGGRLKRLQPILGNEPFLLTYGDGVSNVPLDQLVAFHKSHGKVATITAVRPPARFGGLLLDGPMVTEFQEKPQIGEGWINGGFMVFEPKIFEYLNADADSLEATALEKLAGHRQLAAMKHDQFWQCMDTLRELKLLERLWEGGHPPWKVWS